MPSKEARVVLGAILVQFALGGVYAWSVFTPYLKEAGWSASQTQSVFSVAIGCIPLGLILGGMLMDRLGPSHLVKLSALVVGSSYLVAGLSGGTSYIVTFSALGIAYGLGIGLGYIVPLSVCVRWFPHRRGLFTGVAAFGFGLGVMVWVKLAGSWGGLLESVGLPETFIIYGLLIAAMVFAGSWWLVFPEQDPDSTPVSIDAQPGATIPTRSLDGECTRREMLAQGRFYAIFLTYTFSSAGGLLALGLMKLYPVQALQEGGLSPEQAAVAAGTAMAVFFSLANAMGRLLWGSISDRIGRKAAVTGMCMSQALCLFLFPAMASGEWSLFAASALVGFNFGGNFALFPALTADAFGPASVGRNYSLVNLAYGAGGMLGPTIGGICGDLDAYPMAFMAGGILCALGGALLFFFLNTPGTGRAAT